MATKTETITARPTLYGAKASKITQYDEFIKGTADLNFGNSSAFRFIFLYGFDFRELANKENVIVTGLSLQMKFVDLGASTSYTRTMRVMTCTNFGLTGTSVTADDLGDEQQELFSTSYGNVPTSLFALTETTLPNTLKWINNNLTKVTSDSYNKYSLGVRLYGRNVNVVSVTLTLEFTYEESGINRIYVGTSQPSKIYVGTQEVKEVYVGTTKVYG